ncbi:hypothetical protein A2W24_03350 [Microgenomates group bacterium RBG_16_45_19]|nr:MAG: hypothetical protein A2W24_03350 [Microgenomates group bacterium RBG_16_45_19]
MRLLALLLGFMLLIGLYYWFFLAHPLGLFSPTTGPQNLDTINQSLNRLETAVTGYQQQLNSGTSGF